MKNIPGNEGLPQDTDNSEILGDQKKIPEDQQLSQEESLDVLEIIRSPEEVREMFKNKFLIIDDGYNYESKNVPSDLPTVFHGTSAWLEEDIKKDGFTNKLDSIENIENVFKIQPDLSKRFKDIMRRGEYRHARMKPDEYRLRRRVYCTLNHKDAEKYGKGPEILREYLELMKRTNQEFYMQKFESIIPQVIKDLGVIDTPGKKLIMSCLEPKILVAHIKATRIEFDSKGTSEYGQGMPEVTFFNSIKGRKELFEKIKWARDRYIQHSKGDLVSINDASRMWDYIQRVTNFTTPEEFEAMSISDLIQVHLRSGSGYEMNSKSIELLFKKINPESILKLENVVMEERQ